MDRFAILNSMLWLPMDGLSATDIAAIKKGCTIRYRLYGETETHTLRAYKVTKNYIVVPRSWGLTFLPKVKGLLDYEDRTATGFSAFEDIAPVQLREGQKPWIDSMVACRESKYDFIGQAATGKGKTVMATEVARRAQATTLVIVDQGNLVNQWKVDTWSNVFHIPEEDIGHIQGDVCDWEGKTIVIAMLQTLIARESTLPKEMFSYFGTVILDEVHTIAAPVYHKVLCMLPATTRFGVTATMKKGPLKKLLDLHLGAGAAVTMQERHKESVVRYIESRGVYSWYANISPKDGRYISEIIVDAKRNVLIAQAVLWLYDSGRDVLVIGARIEHLEWLISLCRLLGVPREAMGQYTGYRNVWKWAKDKTPASRPKHLHKDAAYTPVKLQLVKKKNKRDDLDVIKDTSPILFATYGMFAKGANVPRLCGGIDVTPRRTAEQVHGRILRTKVEGKLTPIWVTIRDVCSFRAEFQFSNRLREYAKSNAEVYQWRIGKGVKHKKISEVRRQAEARAELLKQARIEINAEGNSTLLIPVIVKE